MNIDKTAPVLVTGATGYVAGWIVKRLLENGVQIAANGGGGSGVNVNVDLSLNAGLAVGGDASFNGDVNIIGNLGTITQWT